MAASGSPSNSRSSSPRCDGDALEHVAVGGEVAAVGDERAVAARVEHGARELEQVDRRGVAGDDLARRRADHRRDQVAGTGGRVDPVRPAPDQPLAPLVDQRGEPLARRDRQPPERVAVEVDPVVRVDEAVAVGGERVGGVGRRGRRAAQRIHDASWSHDVTARHSGFSGSRCPKWPSRARRTTSTSSPAARAAAANRSLIAGGTMSSSPPWVNSAGTPSGSRSAGEAAA